MKNDKVEFKKIDCSNLSKYELENRFYEAAVCVFMKLFPNEKISDDSVSVGNIYINKKYISCQIKFTDNDLICQCKYDKEQKKIIIKTYKLLEEHNIIYATIENDDTPRYIICNS